MNKIILVIPCFNEENRIRSEHFIDALSHCQNLHWLFVNDGSTDDTLATLKRLQKGHEDRIHIHDLEENQGKGEAVRQGLLQAIRLGADVTGFFHVLRENRCLLASPQEASSTSGYDVSRSPVRPAPAGSSSSVREPGRNRRSPNR